MAANANRIEPEHFPAWGRTLEEQRLRCEADMMQQIFLALSQIQKRAVNDLNQIFAHLEAGTYGYCSACHQKISAERLETLLFPLRCAACEELHQR